MNAYTKALLQQADMIDRALGAHIHPTPIPLEERHTCFDCGVRMRERDVLWDHTSGPVVQDIALCEKCYYKRDRGLRDEDDYDPWYDEDGGFDEWREEML